MSDQFWLSEEQVARIEPYFPLSHGVLRVDDRRVVSGIIHVIRNGLRWCDAPADYGPHKRGDFPLHTTQSRTEASDNLLQNLIQTTAQGGEFVCQTQRLE